MLNCGDLALSNPLICGWGMRHPERKRASHEAHQMGKREAGTHPGVLPGTSKPEAIFLTCGQIWQLQLKFNEHLLCTHQSSKPSGVLIPLTLTTVCQVSPGVTLPAPHFTTEEMGGQEVNYFAQGHGDSKG